MKARRLFALTVCAILFSSMALAFVPTYYSQSTGDLNSLSAWNTVRGGGGSAPSSFSGSYFVVQSGHTLTASGDITFGTLTIESGGAVDCRGYTISGSAFTLSSGGTLYIGSAAGITSSGASGNIQTTSRSYSVGGNYHFNGTAGAQATGNGLPANVNDLGANNPNGVTLSVNTAVNGTLSLNSGTFAVGAHTLALYAPISGTPSNLSADNTAWIRFLGTASGINLPSSVAALNIFELDNANGTLLNGSLSVKQLRLVSGQLNLNGQTLTLVDNVIVRRYAAGSLSGAPTFAGSVFMNYDGSSSLTTGPELPASATYMELIINNTATTSLGAASTVSVVTLGAGVLDLNSQVLTIANYGTIKRLNGTISAEPAFAGVASVEYYNAATTGPEIPSSSSVLQDLSVKGNFVLTLGSNFTPNANVIIYNGSIASGGYALSYGPAATLFYYNIPSNKTTNDTEWPSLNGPYHVQINSALGVNLHAPRSVNGNVTLQSGTFALGSNPLTVNGTLLLIGGSVTGSSIVYGPNSTLAYGGSSVITTSDLLFPSSNGPKNVSFSNSNDALLHASRRITGSLSFNKILDLQSNVLTLGPSATIYGTVGSATKMIVASSSSGELRKEFTGTGSFFFPVGDNSGTVEYSPINLSFTSGTFDTTSSVGVKVFNVKHPSNTSTSPYVSRYWTVSSNSIATFQSTVMFYYADGDIVGTEADLYGASYNGSNWTVFSPVNTAENKGTATVTSFGDITAGEQLALPVTLCGLSVTSGTVGAEIRWSTATETNNDGFEIERRNVTTVPSTVRWRTVGFVAGAGTSTSEREYSFVDRGVAAGRYAYRIKQIDKDGSFKYSGEAEVEVGLAPNEFTLGQNYPNPFNPTTTIRFTLAENARTTLTVCDLLGREVVRLVDGELKAGILHQAVFDGNGLPSGLYFAHLRSGIHSTLVKMLMAK